MKLEQVIKTLLQTSSQIKFMYETVKTIHNNKKYIRLIKIEDEFYRKTPFDIATAGFILNYILIQSCSWIDEYNEGLSPYKHPEKKNDIIKLKRILKPAKKRINEWKDLKIFRNQILAHGLKRNGEYILVKGKKVSYNIPRTNTEIFLLSNLIFIMMQEISKAFPEIINRIDLNESINDFLDINLNEVDVKSELEIINLTISNLKKGYSG